MNSGGKGSLGLGRTGRGEEVLWRAGKGGGRVELNDGYDVSLSSQAAFFPVISVSFIHI